MIKITERFAINVACIYKVRYSLSTLLLLLFFCNSKLLRNDCEKTILITATKDFHSIEAIL